MTVITVEPTIEPTAAHPQQEALHSPPPDLAGEAGMTTAEYAVGTIATCGAGGLLFKVITSDWFMGIVRSIIDRATGAFL